MITVNPFFSDNQKRPQSTHVTVEKRPGKDSRRSRATSEYQMRNLDVENREDEEERLEREEQKRIMRHKNKSKSGIKFFFISSVSWCGFRGGNGYNFTNIGLLGIVSLFRCRLTDCCRIRYIQEYLMQNSQIITTNAFDIYKYKWNMFWHFTEKGVKGRGSMA